MKSETELIDSGDSLIDNIVRVDIEINGHFGQQSFSLSFAAIGRLAWVTIFFPCDSHLHAAVIAENKLQWHSEKERAGRGTRREKRQMCLSHIYFYCFDISHPHRSDEGYKQRWCWVLALEAIRHTLDRQTWYHQRDFWFSSLQIGISIMTAHQIGLKLLLDTTVCCAIERWMCGSKQRVEMGQ